MDNIASIFMAEHKGKCGYCEEWKPLDEMLRDVIGKGHYHCIDCEVDKQNFYYSNLWLQLKKEIKEAKIILQSGQKNKLDKLMEWAFG